MHAVTGYFLDLRSRLAGTGPGFSAVVLQHGEVTFELHHGLASVELQVPLSGDSAYYLASESKQFTAACVLMLVRDGLVALDDDVAAHLPELRGFAQPFPLRCLLNHSSGIPDYFPFLHCQLGRHDGDYFDNAYILRLVSHLDTVEFPTSTRHGYSNSNYILLAALVERLAGVPLAQYAKTRLFEPLGMHRLTFDADRFGILPNRVFSYETDATRPQSLKQSLGNANTVGDGGVYGSTDELVRWERAWHEQWAQPGSLLHDMLQPSPLSDGSTPGYRFGLEIAVHEGEEYVFHAGGLWGFTALLLRFPARRMSIIHLANCDAAEVDLRALLACVATA